MSSRALLLDVRPWAALLLALSLPSCKDDPELVRKSAEQKAEITKLDGELKILQEKIEHLPVDRSAELAKLQQQVEENKTAIEALEKETAELEATKAKDEKALADYQRKYPTR